MECVGRHVRSARGGGFLSLSEVLLIGGIKSFGVRCNERAEMIGIVVEDAVDVIGGKYKGLKGRVKKLTTKMVVVQVKDTGECVRVMKENVSKDLKGDDVGPKEVLKRAIQVEFVAMQKRMDELILLMEKL